MLLRILKNDLRRKRTMNIIIFLFISISAMFLASSTTDMLVVSRGVDYYLDKSNVPGYVVLENVSSDAAKKGVISDWLSRSNLVTDYTAERSIITSSDSMIIHKSS